MSKHISLRIVAMSATRGGTPLDQAEFESHLSRIETQWTAVVHAHRAHAGEAGEARATLLERYGGALRRYLLASLRDIDAADDLAQEFALRFLLGDFKNADPGRGRFRDYLKRAVYHLMMDHHRRRRTNPRFLGDDAARGGRPGSAPTPGTSKSTDNSSRAGASSSWPMPGPRREGPGSAPASRSQRS